MNNLDNILVDCLKLITNQQLSTEYCKKHHGLVGAAIITKEFEPVLATSTRINSKKFAHAERSAIEKFHKKHGKIPKDAILFTTLSPCFEPMPDRQGCSCSDLIEKLGIKKVYTGLYDGSQEKYDHDYYKNVSYDLKETSNQVIKDICKKLLHIIEHLQIIQPKI